MAGEIAPTVAVAEAPLSAAPEAVAEASATPVVETAVEAAPVETAAVEAAAAAEAPPEEKPAEPVVDAKADEPKVEPEKAEPPTYEAFKLPDGFQAAPEQLAAYTEALGKYGLSQEAGQELMDLHGEALKSAVEKITQSQQDVFSETQRKWVSDFEKQAGNRRDTVANDAKWAISELVPNKEKRAEIWQALAFTGAGNHPAIVFMMAAAAKRMRERSASPAPLPNNGARGGSRADRRYGAQS